MSRESRNGTAGKARNRSSSSSKKKKKKNAAHSLRRENVGCTQKISAVLTRCLFLLHTGIALWRVSILYPPEYLYFLSIGVFFLLLEMIFTLAVRQGKEYKWFCPSVFFYLLSVVPCLWLLELHHLNTHLTTPLVTGGCVNVYLEPNATFPPIPPLSSIAIGVNGTTRLRRSVDDRRDHIGSSASSYLDLLRRFRRGSDGNSVRGKPKSKKRKRDRNPNARRRRNKRKRSTSPPTSTAVATGSGNLTQLTPTTTVASAAGRKVNETAENLTLQNSKPGAASSTLVATPNATGVAAAAAWQKVNVTAGNSTLRSLKPGASLSTWPSSTTLVATPNTTGRLKRPTVPVLSTATQTSQPRRLSTSEGTPASKSSASAPTRSSIITPDGSALVRNATREVKVAPNDDGNYVNPTTATLSMANTSSPVASTSAANTQNLITTTQTPTLRLPTTQPTRTTNTVQKTSTSSTKAMASSYKTAKADVTNAPTLTNAPTPSTTTTYLAASTTTQFTSTKRITSPVNSTLSGSTEIPFSTLITTMTSSTTSTRHKDKDIVSSINEFGNNAVKYLQNTSDTVNQFLNQLQPESWLLALHQVLLFVLVIGRWLLPKGEITRDQLSQLLLVFIGVGADILEFVSETIDDDVRGVRCDPLLHFIIYGVWSWSLLQFTLVLTAAKSRKTRVGFESSGQVTMVESGNTCCARSVFNNADLWGILVTMLLQDVPFLAFRLYMMIVYRQIHQMMVFFTGKNVLVVFLQIYRLIVLKVERKADVKDDASEAELLPLKGTLKRLASQARSETSDFSHGDVKNASFKSRNDGSVVVKIHFESEGTLKRKRPGTT